MNKTCEQHGKLMAFHDGQLSPQEALAMETHLQQCPVCASELGQWRKLSDYLQRAPRPQLSARVLAQLQQSLPPVEDFSAYRLAWRLTVAASMIVAISLLGLQVSSSSAQSALPAWEMEAGWVQAGEQAEAMEYQTAQWIVAGLSVAPPQGYSP